MKEKRFSINIKHGGHIIAFGQTGAGKSVTLERIAEIFFDHGWKVFDIDSTGRMEGAFFSLPSKFPYWKNKLKDLDGKEYQAEGHNTRLLFPLSRNLPKTLPDISKPFTIPINSLEFSDLQTLLGFEINTNIRNL